VGKNISLWDHCDPQNHAPQIVAVKLSAKGERSVRQHHPWIFDQNILKTNKTPKAGDIGIIFAYKSNKVIGLGLMDPKSPIAIKMIHFDGGAEINEAFFLDLFKKAIEKRTPLIDKTNAMRLVFGENDGLPGLIVDQYDAVMVVKIYSLMWLPYMALIKEVLLSLCAPKSIVLRANRHVSRALKLEEEDQVVLIYGSLPNPEIEFHEYGVRFLAHVLKGHKTGFFLDHRNNRHRVGQLSHGKRVLDVFAYAGGFGVHALANGAKQVTSIDISAQALSLAEKNAALNEFTGKHETLCGDAFDLLQQQIKKGIQYDVVVIDPPSFANSADGVDLALNKYETLTRLGTQLVAKKGWLILASCSSRVDMDQFLQAHKKGFTAAKTQDFNLIEKTGHDIDHAVGFEHGHYLKTAYYRRK